MGASLPLTLSNTVGASVEFLPINSKTTVGSWHPVAGSAQHASLSLKAELRLMLLHRHYITMHNVHLDGNDSAQCHQEAQWAAHWSANRAIKTAGNNTCVIRTGSWQIGPRTVGAQRRTVRARPSKAQFA